MKLISRLRTIPMIGRLHIVTLGFLADALEQESYAAGQTIYEIDDAEDRVIFIDSGQVKLRWSNGSVDWLGNGAAFGMLNQKGAGHKGGLRAMQHTAEAATRSDFLIVPYDQFRAITAIDPDIRATEEMQIRTAVIEPLVIFHNLTVEQRHHLIGFFSHYHFPANQLLIQQGEEADSLWVLLEGGQALIQALDGDGAKLLSTRSHGITYFGETALLGQVPQDSTVEAMAGSDWMRLHWSDFQHFDDLEPDDMRSVLDVRTKKREAIASQIDRRKYAWLQPGELVVLLSRRHWIAYLRKGVPAFITFAFFVAIAVLGSFVPGYQLWIMVPAGILAIIAFGLFVWGTIDYFNDWILVTNRRVVHQEKVLFVNEWRKEAPLEQIQNINFEVTFLGRWLNYGTLVIQTASTSGVIRFDYTTHFNRLNSVINAQRSQRRRHAAAQSKTTISRTLESRLGLRLTLPSRVYRDRTAAEPDLTRWERFGRRSHRRLRREEDDRIVWRKHWLVLLPKLWWALLILLFVLVITLLPSVIIDRIPETARPATYMVQIIAFFLTIVSFLRVVWVVANWHNDTYEVSNQEIVHVEKLPLSLTEDRKSAGLAQIQNVEMLIPSPFHWLFNYGIVRCQTAAEEGDFVFSSVPDPRSVAEEIQVRMERFRRRLEEDAARKRAQELPDWFEIYHKLETDDFPG